MDYLKGDGQGMEIGKETETYLKKESNCRFRSITF
jgi:hypothetical protein